jgi:hypothetical protein
VPSSFNGWMYAEQIDNTTDVLPHVVLAHIRSLQSMVLLDACTIRSVAVLPLNFCTRLQHADAIVHCHVSLAKIGSARDRLANFTAPSGSKFVDVSSPFHRPHACTGDAGITNQQVLLELEMYVRMLLLRSLVHLGNFATASTQVEEMKSAFLDISSDVGMYYGHLLLAVVRSGVVSWRVHSLSGVVQRFCTAHACRTGPLMHW